MHVPVEVQVWRLSVLFLAGVATHVLFEAYRAFRSVLRLRKLSYHVLDILVALGTMGAIGWIIYSINRGEVRMYIPLSLGCGFLASRALVGSILYRGARQAFLKTGSSARWFGKHVIGPARKALQTSVEWLTRAVVGDETQEPPGKTGS